jgi:hypothetical protein
MFGLLLYCTQSISGSTPSTAYMSSLYHSHTWAVLSVAWRTTASIVHDALMYLHVTVVRSENRLLL